MSQLRLNLAMASVTCILFLAALAVNELLFRHVEFAPGIAWIYLPAGVRLLSTLLFAEAGAIGLLIVSWLVCFLYFFPNDPVRAFMGGILASAAPYLVYRVMQMRFGFDSNLANLSPKRLLYCALVFSLASPALHHLWFALYEHPDHLLKSFSAMAIGDLSGTLIVLYSAKFVLLKTAKQNA
jgi:hypothetical protein